jgi:hypothetical protein
MQTTDAPQVVIPLIDGPAEIRLSLPDARRLIADRGGPVLDALIAELATEIVATEADELGG